MTASGDYVIEMKNIRKEFPGIIANDGITLQVKRGEIHAILGENGAGKSTLMSILFGLVHPDEGEIFVKGKKFESPILTMPVHWGSVWFISILS